VKFPPELDQVAAGFPHKLVFATVSGAHLYGFPSPDSDYDLRGCHVLPLAHRIGLRAPKETIERLGPDGAIELDLVSHDVRKFCRLLLRRNGYVLEQLLSPLVVVTTPEHEELKALVPQLVTRHHAHHYLGFSRNQWRLFEKRPRVKALLYVYRVLLTGIHLMRSGEIQAALPALLDDYPIPGVPDLIAAKTGGVEKLPLSTSDVARHRPEFDRLTRLLEQARDDSDLPEAPTAFDALDDLTVRLALDR